MQISEKTQKILIKIAVQVGFVGLFLGGVFYLKQISPNRDDFKLKEIKTEITKVPIFPGFVKTDEKFTSRYSDASGNLYFSSNASRGHVQSFYNRELPKLGWRIVEDGDTFSFKKNDLRFIISHQRSSSSGNYTLRIEWKEK